MHDLKRVKMTMPIYTLINIPDTCSWPGKEQNGACLMNNNDYMRYKRRKKLHLKSFYSTVVNAQMYFSNCISPRLTKTQDGTENCHLPGWALPTQYHLLAWHSAQGRSIITFLSAILGQRWIAGLSLLFSEHTPAIVVALHFNKPYFVACTSVKIQRISIATIFVNII